MAAAKKPTRAWARRVSCSAFEGRASAVALDATGHARTRTATGLPLMDAYVDLDIAVRPGFDASVFLSVGSAECFAAAILEAVRVAKSEPRTVGVAPAPESGGMKPSDHPDENAIAALVAGQASASEVEAIERHLDACPNCLDLVAAAAREEVRHG